MDNGDHPQQHHLPETQLQYIHTEMFLSQCLANGRCLSQTVCFGVSKNVCQLCSLSLLFVTGVRFRHLPNWKTLARPNDANSSCYHHAIYWGLLLKNRRIIFIARRNRIACSGDHFPVSAMPQNVSRASATLQQQMPSYYLLYLQRHLLTHHDYLNSQWRALS